MKGTTYGGIVHLPEHPDADLHGLVRVAIRAGSFLAAKDLLAEKYGVVLGGGWNTRIWQTSSSHAEILATERQYGVLLACPLAKQYLRPEDYQPVKVQRKAPAAASRPRTGMVPKETR